MHTFDRVVSYAGFKFEMVNIYGYLLDFLDESEAERFLIEYDMDDLPLWSRDGDLSLIEYDDIKDRIPEELKAKIEAIINT